MKIVSNLFLKQGDVMKKLILFLAVVGFFAITENGISQKLDMRTKEGKASVKNQKKLDAAMGGVNMFNNSFSDKEKRAKSKEGFKKTTKSVGETSKNEFNKVKDAWKNRKNK